MTRLIKCGSAEAGADIQRWHAIPSQSEPDGRVYVLSSEDEEIARLQALLATKGGEIADLQAAVIEARVAGEEAGRLALEFEIEDSRNAQLALLEAGFAEGQRAFAEWLQGLETLALGVAGAALEKMFGEDADRTATVAALIRKQLDEFERHACLAVEVSRSDFPHTGEVTALAARLGLEAERLTVSDLLQPGDCRLRLALGSVDVGFGQQWGMLRDQLATIAAGNTR